MNQTVHEVLEFVKENEIMFIRLGFCDLQGRQKCISIMPDELLSAFERGVSFDAHAISGFRDVTKSDLLLFPDPATMMLQPWRPGAGRVLRFCCDICNPDGSAYAHDSRYILKSVLRRCEQMGYLCKIGAECEFYLFKTDENGEPTDEPMDKGSYLDVSPMDRGEDIRREICLYLKELGIMPEAAHHEQGPGQSEIDFRFNDALISADSLITFKAIVKAISARNGLFASFMPKPIPGMAGNGMHINISLAQNGQNLFRSFIGETIEDTGTPDVDATGVVESFIAGVLSKTPEMTLFLNPLANSYERFGEFEAPRFVSWSHQNRSQLIRIPAASGEKVRMELRSPDPSLNPYLAFALIITAGLDAIEQSQKLPPAVDENLFVADERVTGKLVKLPGTLKEAIRCAEDSKLVRTVLGDELLQKYLAIKEKEWLGYFGAVDRVQFNKEQYFPMT